MKPDYLPERCLTLIEAVIDQAVMDYTGLKAMSAIRRDGSVNGFFWSRRRAGGYRSPKNMVGTGAADDLIYFLTSMSLDFLCYHLPTSSNYAFPCRIRKKLGLSPREEAR